MCLFTLFHPFFSFFPVLVFFPFVSSVGVFCTSFLLWFNFCFSFVPPLLPLLEVPPASWADLANTNITEEDRKRRGVCEGWRAKWVVHYPTHLKYSQSNHSLLPSLPFSLLPSGRFSFPHISLLTHLGISSGSHLLPPSPPCLCIHPFIPQQAQRGHRLRRRTIEAHW